MASKTRKTLKAPYKLLHSPYWYANNEHLRAYIKEKHPNAIFIEEIALSTGRGGFTDNPGLVFYQENPPAPFTNKYFAYGCHTDVAAVLEGRERHDQWFICAQHDWDPVVDAAIHEPSRSVAISRYRHDFFDFGGGFIDGGRDYTRLGGAAIPRVVKLNLHTMTFEDKGVTYHVDR